jgi:hypothetical protein
MVDLSALTGGLDLNALTAGAGIDLSAITGGLGLDVGGLDLGSLLGGLTGGSSAPVSKCAADDTACKEEEDRAAAEAKIKKQREDDAKFKEQYDNPESSSTGLVCSMDGMTDMSVKLVENLLLIVSLLKELLALALEGEPKLNESLQLIWKGFLGGSTWMGYAMYALYAVG